MNESQKMEAILHIYGQFWEHDDARIAGNRAALERLAEGISRALNKGSAIIGREEALWASNGEGYELEIICLNEADSNDPIWEDYPPYYIYC